MSKASQSEMISNGFVPDARHQPAIEAIKGAHPSAAVHLSVLSHRQRAPTYGGIDVTCPSNAHSGQVHGMHWSGTGAAVRNFSPP